MMEKRKRYSEIVLLHCMGTLMIIVTHIAYVNGYNKVGELLASGIPLFLWVSGFLVGVKPVAHNITWVTKKAKRILVPYYILLIVVLIVYLILKTEPFQWKQWVLLFANMQGLTNFVFYNDITGYFSPLVQGLGHFWYVTVIMLCYLLVPFFEKISEFKLWKKNQLALLLITIFFIQPVLLFYNVQIRSFVLFILGYLFAKNNVIMTGKRFGWATLVMVLCVILRLVGRLYLDDTVVYDKYIASLSGSAIGLWIVALVFYLRYKMPKFIDAIASWRFVVWFESIIYEVYLIHHIIIKGSWSFYTFGLNPIVATMMILAVTICLSLLLKAATQFVTSRIIK